jgi:hypothetical protein
MRRQTDRGGQRGKVIVEQHQSGGFARHVGAAPAHRHADVRGLERGRIVHAVAGHRDDLAVGLERFHDAQLLLRHDAREYMHVAQSGAQCFIG